MGEAVCESCQECGDRDRCIVAGVHKAPHLPLIDDLLTHLLTCLLAYLLTYIPLIDHGQRAARLKREHPRPRHA